MKTNYPKSIISLPLKVLAAFILIFTAGCTNNMDDSMGPIVNPPANEILIQGMAFTPASLTVTAGTTVTWTNKDGVIHNVTSDTGVFSSGSIADNGTYSYKFVAAGTYPYHCTVHPSMTGTVIVN